MYECVHEHNNCIQRGYKTNAKERDRERRKCLCLIDCDSSGEIVTQQQIII